MLETAASKVDDLDEALRRMLEQNVLPKVMSDHLRVRVVRNGLLTSGFRSQ